MSLLTGLPSLSDDDDVDVGDADLDRFDERLVRREWSRKEKNRNEVFTRRL